MKPANKTKHTLLPLAAALVCLLAAGCDPEPKERQYHPTTEGTIVKGKVALILWENHCMPCVALNLTDPADYGTMEGYQWCCAERYAFEYNNTVLIPNPFNNDREVMMDVPGAEMLKKLDMGKTLVVVCSDTNRLPHYLTWEPSASTQDHFPPEARMLSVREVLDVY